MTCDFSFERTDVFRLSCSVARWFREARWPSGSAHLKDQGCRAAESVVLNIAEGWSSRSRAGRNHFRIAHGSAGEALAVLHLVDLPGRDERMAELRRVGAMLDRLRR